MLGVIRAHTEVYISPNKLVKIIPNLKGFPSSSCLCTTKTLSLEQQAWKTIWEGAWDGTREFFMNFY